MVAERKLCPRSDPPTAAMVQSPEGSPGAQPPNSPGPLSEPVGGGVGLGGERVGLTQSSRDPETPSSRDPSVRELNVDGSPDNFSSASEAGSVLTRRDFQRVKSRLVRMSEHLRDSLKSTKAELWQAIEEIGPGPAFQQALDERTDLLSEALRTGLDNIRDEFFNLIEPLTVANTVRGEEMAAELAALRQRTADLEATLHSVAQSAQDAAQQLSAHQHQSQSDWSDWSLAETEDFQELKARVEALEASDPGVLAPGVETPAQLYADLLERVADLESEGRRRPCGTGAGLPSKGNPKIAESKVVANLGPLTDDKNAFRQWDLKMVNALSQVRKSYGRAIERMKQFVDRGKDPEDARMAATSDRMSATSGPTLADMIYVASQGDESDVDIEELNDDLSFILIDKAKPGSDILQRVHNLQAQGGIRMYAEVYKFFTETSGRGLSQEVVKLMKPKQANREEHIAEEIETWEEHMNRLARHGKD